MVSPKLWSKYRDADALDVAGGIDGQRGSRLRGGGGHSDSGVPALRDAPDVFAEPVDRAHLYGRVPHA